MCSVTFMWELLFHAAVLCGLRGVCVNIASHLSKTNHMDVSYMTNNLPPKWDTLQSNKLHMLWYVGVN